MFFEAASDGDLQKIGNLIDKGININMQNSNGWTAIHFASSSGQKHIVEYLINLKADINIKDSDDENSIFHGLHSI